MVPGFLHIAQEDRTAERQSFCNLVAILLDLPPEPSELGTFARTEVSATMLNLERIDCVVGCLAVLRGYPRVEVFGSVEEFLLASRRVVSCFNEFQDSSRRCIAGVVVLGNGAVDLDDSVQSEVQDPREVTIRLQDLIGCHRDSYRVFIGLAVLVEDMLELGVEQVVDAELPFLGSFSSNQFEGPVTNGLEDSPGSRGLVGGHFLLFHQSVVEIPELFVTLLIELRQLDEVSASTHVVEKFSSALQMAVVLAQTFFLGESSKIPS